MAKEMESGEFFFHALYIFTYNTPLRCLVLVVFAVYTFTRAKKGSRLSGVDQYGCQVSNLDSQPFG